GGGAHASEGDRWRVGWAEPLGAPVWVPATPGSGTTAVDANQVRSSVASICSWLRSVVSKDLVIVLDDLHGLQPDGDVTQIIKCLCHCVPDRLHLILISRCELPFSLQRLRCRGLVTEIHAPDLAFDIADVEALLRKTVGADPPGLSRQVWGLSGGWPAAVHSAIEMLRGAEPEKRLSAVRRLSHPGERFH